jgi:glycosyltransferase 2 family protein
VLPGRIGELARVAVINRRLPEPRGATLVGTVFAHRVFDLVPVVALILYVLATAKIPAWAYSSLIAVVAVGGGLFIFAFLSARHFDTTRRLDGVGAARRIVAMMRQGLGVMHRPLPAAAAIAFQTLGWFCQLFAVYTAMRAFHIHLHIPAAALVLLVMNVVNVIPLWPGNVGAVQAAIALPLTSYGVAYADGIAFGFGLQAIEASVGIGIGLVFLAREGLSFATLRGMPGAAQMEAEKRERPPESAEVRASPSARGRARV